MIIHLWFEIKIFKVFFSNIIKKTLYLQNLKKKYTQIYIDIETYEV
jgi:hypothetical protein